MRALDQGTCVAGRSSESLTSVRAFMKWFRWISWWCSVGNFWAIGAFGWNHLSADRNSMFSKETVYALWVSQFFKAVFFFFFWTKMTKWQDWEIILKWCLFIIALSPPVAWQPAVWVVTSEDQLSQVLCLPSQHPRGAWRWAEESHLASALSRKLA